MFPHPEVKVAAEMRSLKSRSAAAGQVGMHGGSVVELRKVILCAARHHGEC
jgi:hypothetical protein